jgi:hypothetical protein
MSVGGIVIFAPAAEAPRVAKPEIPGDWSRAPLPSQARGNVPCQAGFA